jgi:hypothetical protein
MRRALIASAAFALGSLAPGSVSAATYNCTKNLISSDGFSRVFVTCHSVQDDNAMFRARAEVTRISDGSHWVFLGDLKDCNGETSVSDPWITGVYRVDAYGWRVFDDTLGGGC